MLCAAAHNTYYVEFLIMSPSVRSVLVSGVCRANLVGIIPAALGWFPRGAGGRALMDRTPGSGEIIPQSSPPTHIYFAPKNGLNRSAAWRR